MIGRWPTNKVKITATDDKKKTLSVPLWMCCKSFIHGKQTVDKRPSGEFRESDSMLGYCL
jgi:hypothetical protein